jgi:hypothetical protein
VIDVQLAFGFSTPLAAIRIPDEDTFSDSSPTFGASILPGIGHQ